MKNQEFELQCKQLVDVKHNEVTKFIGTILNKEGKELDKSVSQHAVLAHILPELLTYGCIVRTTTKDIAEACNCKVTVVNNVLGFAGFKYERDRLTHKPGHVSKGLFERYYQYEYTDNGATKKTSSVFNIVATQKLFDLFAEELGLDIKVEADELAKLHKDSKEKAYTKSVKRETVVVTFTRETTVFSNVRGTTNTVQYSGIEEAMEQLQELQAEQQEEVKPVVEELEIQQEEDEELEWLELEDDEEEVVVEPEPVVAPKPVVKEEIELDFDFDEEEFDLDDLFDEEPETDYSAGLEDPATESEEELYDVIEEPEEDELKELEIELEDDEEEIELDFDLDLPVVKVQPKPRNIISKGFKSRNTFVDIEDDFEFTGFTGSNFKGIKKH